MGYLYKLVDEYGLKNAQKGVISLSHPIFEFKGSEGKFINFAKRIYDRYQQKGLNIKPTQRDLEEIKEWCHIYKSTYGEFFNDKDIYSESMIVFCGIMQGFCGYFTTVDLSNATNKKAYISECKLKEKKAIIKINERALEHSHWRSKNVEGNYVPFDGYPNDCRDFNGFLHLKNIQYIEKYDDYNELLSLYNKDEVRHASTWFSVLSKEYEWQKEKRLIFLLRSMEPNSSRIGCDTVYNPCNGYNSLEEVVYGNIVDAIHYCNNGPKYINLELKNDEIEILSL